MSAAVLKISCSSPSKLAPCTSYLQQVYMVLEYLDIDLHRFVRKAPQLMPNNPHLVKVRAPGLAQCLPAAARVRRRGAGKSIFPRDVLLRFALNCC